jgi:hypothetical protein
MNLHLLCECLGPVNQALAELQMAPLSTNDFPAVTACKRQLSELDIYIEIRRKINAYVSVCYECDTMPGPKGHSPGQRTLLGLFCPGAGTATHCDVRVGALCCELANLFTLSNGLPVDGSVSPLIDVSRRLVSVGGDKGYFPAATLGSFLLGLRCGPARMAFVRGDFESPNTIRTLGRGPTSANRIKAVQECLRRIRFHVDEIGHASCGEPLPGCHVDYVHEGLTALRLWMRLPGVASLDIGEAPCSLAQIVDELLPAVIDSCYVTDSPVDFEVSSGFVIP